MKYNNLFFSLFCTLFLLTSCGSSDDDFGTDPRADNCLGFGTEQLSLKIQDHYTTLPGKVSVFFKVTTKDGNKPVSGLTASNFKIYEKGSNDNCPKPVSPSESNGRISSKSQIFNTNTLLVLDLSNSVLSTSLEELKVASTSFIEEVMPATASDEFKMGVYWFDGEDALHELHPITTDRSALTTAIQGITSDISSDPSTDLYGAVIKATDSAKAILDTNKKEEILAAASIVIFTDGTDQANRYLERDALNKVKNADENISFFTIGLGSEIDTAILDAIGKNGSAYAANKEELEETFDEISDDVEGQSHSFYLFEYCSPTRSGRNTLTIRAVQSESVAGSVQTEFDATGFTGGCE